MARRTPRRQPGPRDVGWRARSRSGSRRSPRRPRPCSSPWATSRSSPRAVIEALLDGKADPARPVAVPTYDDERGRNPVLLRRAAFGLVAEAAGDRGLGPVLAAHPEMVAEVAGPRREPRRGHPGRPRPRHRSVVGPARPGEPRAGRAHPRGPRRRGLLRARQLAVPGRPDRGRRSGPGGAPRARPVGRHVARRRRGRRSFRAADRPRARPVGRFGGGPRRVAVDARGPARDRRGPRASRTSGRSRRAGRRPTRASGGASRPTSP